MERDEATLERAVRELRAIEAIKQLKAHYWRMLDQYLEADVAPLFAEHATLDFMTYGQVVGREAIVDFYVATVFPAYDMMVHHGSNPEIEITGATSAKAVWQYEAWMLIKGRELGYWHAGWYEDEYLLDGDSWRISYSKGIHHFNSRVENQWAKRRFENEEWPPLPTDRSLR